MITVDEAVDQAMEIQGWKTREEMVWLARQAAKARIVVDVGCWRGRTTKAMSAVCHGIVIAVDHLSAPYSGETARNEIIKREGNLGILKDFSKNLEKELEVGKVYGVFQDGDAARKDVAAFLGAGGVDFVWIDGDHGYEDVVADIKAYGALLAPNGILSGHDYAPEFPDVVRAVNELCPGFARGHGTSWHVPRKNF